MQTNAWELEQSFDGNETPLFAEFTYLEDGWHNVKCQRGENPIQSTRASLHDTGDSASFAVQVELQVERVQVLKHLCPQCRARLPRHSRKNAVSDFAEDVCHCS